MATFNLRRFSKPEMLRRIDRKHLIAFLEPHAAYFSARGVELPPVQQEDGLDYNALSHLLLTPDSTTPDDLAEALFYVNEVSTPRVLIPFRMRSPERTSTWKSGRTPPLQTWRSRFGWLTGKSSRRYTPSSSS